MKRPTTRLNQHEKEIIQAFDRDELVLHDPTPALLAGFAEAAENTTRKDRRINIRLSRIVRPMALPQPLSSL